MRKISLLSLLIIAIHSAVSIQKRKVCIIGTGPSGLAATKYLAEYPDEFEPVTFEKNADVGGMWIYSDSTTVDEHGFPVHSSLYKYLRLNGPKHFMTYYDFAEFTAGEGTFVSHTYVLDYLKNYTDHFNLRRYIQFNTNVEKVSFTRRNKWRVKARNLNTNKLDETVCDVFIAASGHHVKENIPKIPGMESFKGRVMHSHLFRKPEEFAGQRVVVIGCGLSGIDLSFCQINLKASKVYLSSRSGKLPSVLPHNLELIDGVVGADGNELIISDGSRVKADAVVFTTGYQYDFPYLDESAGIRIEDGKYVRPLYKHMINIERPTMAILNIPNPGYGYIVPQAQMAYYRAVLRGKVTLPSRERMMEEEKLPEGTPKHKAHYMLGEVFEYYDSLAIAGGCPPLPRWFAPAYWTFYNVLIQDPAGYREKNLYVWEDGRVAFY